MEVLDQEIRANAGEEAANEGADGEDGDVHGLAAVDECVGYRVVIVAPKGCCVVADVAIPCQNLTVASAKRVTYLIVINPIPVNSPISENKK